MQLTRAFKLSIAFYCYQTRGHVGMVWEGNHVYFQSSHNVTRTLWVLSSSWHIFCWESIAVGFISISFCNWGTLRCTGLKCPALNHVTLLEPGLKAPSGICDHIACQNPKGKTIQLGASQNCTCGWFWSLRMRFGEILCVALLAWLSRAEQLPLSSQSLGKGSSNWNSVEKDIEYLFRTELWVLINN